MAAAAKTRTKSKSRTLDEIKQEIISKLDIAAEYEAMGLRLAGAPRASGFCEAYAAGRDDGRPSAWINVNSGKYGDSSAELEQQLSFFDFALKYGRIPGVNDFTSCLKHFSAKANVPLREPPPDPFDKIKFEEWTDSNLRLAEMWCIRFKPGATVEAILAAGGRCGRYPCVIDQETGERKEGRYRVIALPAWRGGDVSRDPSCWVLWNMIGKDLGSTKAKNGQQAQPIKMRTIGPSFGAMMNLQALAVLADPDRRKQVKLAWKTGGPSDMLALIPEIPRRDRSTILVTTNASGETGDIPPDVIELFVGIPFRVIGDADEAGFVGGQKWINAIGKVSMDCRHVLLKTQEQITKKHGFDLRDWINEQRKSVESETTETERELVRT